MQKRLDRFLTNPAWINMFAWNRINHLSKRRSDYIPILATYKKDFSTTNTVLRRDRPVRFEKVWTKAVDCEENVKGSWAYGLHMHVGDKLKYYCRELKEVYGADTKAVRRDIEEKNKAIEKLKRDPPPPTTENIGKIRGLVSQVEELEANEVTMWAQRSKQSWLKEGDKNTSFFHEKATQRKGRNKILHIKNEEGIWKEKEEDIQKVSVQYFEYIFKAQDTLCTEAITSLVKPSVTHDMNARLLRRFTGEEVLNTLHQMHQTKALGPDGMLGLFFQKYWHVMGSDVLSFISSILNDGVSPQCVNQTLITLIPKVKFPTSPKESYKLV